MHVSAVPRIIEFMKASVLKHSAKKLLEVIQEAEMMKRDFSELLNTELEESSASDFATVIGVSPQYVSDVRKGRRSPGQSFLKKLIEVS